MSSVRYIFWGSVLLALAVAFGAFGAHALKSMLTPTQLTTFQTAVQYQFYHAFALILVGLLYRQKASTRLKQAGLAFFLGLIFFCGSLYVMTVGSLTRFDLKWVGAITPLGGISFMVGWVMVALTFSKK
ncbi:MAG: DUF423 domain-containing protein [Bacteroidetes bacterium]|nr:MAG: DUF423 domain-containing protein [Bacteroidota bacterium]